MAKGPKDDKEPVAASANDTPTALESDEALTVAGASAEDTLTGGAGPDSVAETDSVSSAADSPWPQRETPEKEDEALSVDSIAPEPLPQPEDPAPDIAPKSEDTSQDSTHQDATPQREKPMAEPEKTEAETKGGGGMIKFLVYLILILAVVGGPIGLLAWNPVIQPWVNEKTELGLPKVYPFGPPAADPALAALEDRVAALESAPAPTADLPDAMSDQLAATSDRVSGVADQVASLEQSLAGLSGQVETLNAATGTSAATTLDGATLAALEDMVRGQIEVSASDISSLNQELDNLRTELRALASAPPSAVSSDSTGESTSLPSQQIAQLSSQIANLGARVENAESQLETIPADPTASLDRIGSRITELATQLVSLSSEISAVASRPVASPDDLAALEAELAEVTATLQTEVETTTAGLEGRIADVAGMIRQGNSANREDQAFVIAVSQFASAIRDGRSFEAELATLQALGAELDTSVAFYAANGVATVPELRVSFPPVARVIVRRALAGEDRSIVGEALNQVADLVSIRRTGVVEGPQADAIIARAEVALNDDDVQGALSAMSELPEELRAIGSEWIKDASAKVNADAEIARLQSVAAQRIGGGE